MLVYWERYDRKRKQFQKDITFWNSPRAISCDPPQSLQLKAFFLPTPFLSFNSPNYYGIIELVFEAISGFDNPGKTDYQGTPGGLNF